VNILDAVTYDGRGLVPAVIQDDDNGEVLMMAWMDREALRRTVATGRVTFWSRSRQEYWVKGETSGHIQKVRSVRLDCDGDCLLIRVEQTGAACHEGYRSCFFRSATMDGAGFETNQRRVVDPETVYGRTG
jgi:phosphoribosyl-AMP cyclohydrolase